jgi:hypothetical protein
MTFVAARRLPLRHGPHRLREVPARRAVSQGHPGQPFPYKDARLEDGSHHKGCAGRITKGDGLSKWEAHAGVSHVLWVVDLAGANTQFKIISETMTILNRMLENCTAGGRLGHCTLCDWEHEYRAR